MPRVSFTPNLRRHVECPPVTSRAVTVREALDAAFAGNGKLRGYILDERGAVRKHVGIAVNGNIIADRERLSDPVKDGDEIYVMQLLSGG